MIVDQLLHILEVGVEHEDIADLAVLLLGSALEEEEFADVLLDSGWSGRRHVLAQALDPRLIELHAGTDFFDQVGQTQRHLSQQLRESFEHVADVAVAEAREERRQIERRRTKKQKQKVEINSLNHIE